MGNFEGLRKKYSEIMKSAWVGKNEFVSELKKLEGKGIDLQESGQKAVFVTLISVDLEKVVFNRDGNEESLPTNKVRCFSTYTDFLCQRKEQ
jgi:hypothetical protein